MGKNAGGPVAVWTFALTVVILTFLVGSTFALNANLSRDQLALNCENALMEMQKFEVASANVEIPEMPGPVNITIYHNQESLYYDIDCAAAAVILYKIIVDEFSNVGDLHLLIGTVGDHKPVRFTCCRNWVDGAIPASDEWANMPDNNWTIKPIGKTLSTCQENAAGGW